MRRIKCFSFFGIVLGVFAAALLGLCSVQNTSALVPNNMASSAVINQSFATPNWHTTVKNHNHALPITMLTSSETGVTLQVSRVDVSAFVNPTQKGQYWNGSFIVTLRFAYTSNQTLSSGLLLCNRITEARLKPEQGTIVSQSYKVADCNVIPRPNTSTTGYLDMNLKVQAAGKLSASTTVSSYVLQIISSNDAPFFTGNLKDGYWELIIPANGIDINFNLNDDANTTGQGDINQNITNIYDQNQREWEQEQQDRENIQNQSDQADQQGQDAGDAAAEKGQTLLQAFGSLITALQQVHVTNCNLPNVTVYSLQLTNMNMCSVSLPTGVSALIGISISVLIVLLGIKLVKRMLKLYKEITG